MAYEKSHSSPSRVDGEEQGEVRRLGTAQQMKMMTRQFFPNGSGSEVQLSPSGMVLGQRVQAQSFWPLGVDNAFSYSGDITYLRAMLPLVDLSLQWCRSKYA